ncbi:hypothetical protein ACT74_04780 [Aggregatibacter actinomycetemcomitans]|uniref:hypothetical protein n=1 Tax=Aggregatibacter actinomycetemcomitans TaxID=714 RepID=UPI0006A6BEAF|nr:hypothetical protein [Aggregatibacter actinomycetemcomitans]AMQ91954.1 hypothetical protein ACT74_04780 [Aggregatibacter actinomycetemcomitans]KOE52936.1 hypothetical protein I23C_0306610 [Aggregatibacter actinomycetemcomitans serotype b str. I23C]TYA28104.1 hypothetical protein FXB92_01825 [Aggregatibacter actinomycetemcomitans]TYA48173.1 hypothetical protein FXB73_01810 [Aggregatibacter actinomycetemcomitans]TYB12931.1 hypothetical protein FXB84_00185 [Aggregatibacter actinomycetemcomitan
MKIFTLLTNNERNLFYLVLLVTVLFLFYPPYLPMVDLPQHAAQVVMLDDLFKQQSKWSDLVQLNWDTPYLTGYFVWWLLYQFTDIVTSSKLLVVFIFLFNVWAVFLLRKSFQAESILEWAAITSFFGFAFQWGFVTFLLAIPIGILFFLSNKNWLETKKYRYFIGIVLLGILSYCSHVLIFSFFCFISYGYFLAIHFRQESYKAGGGVIFTLPYLLFAIILIRYLGKTDLLQFKDYSENYVFLPFWYKVFTLIYYPWNMDYAVLYNVAWIVFFILPSYMGYTLTKDIKRYIPFIGFLILWFSLPHALNQTAFIYERFSIFMLPFYYLIFEKRSIKKNNGNIIFFNLMFFIFVFLLMGKVYYNNIQFNNDPNMRAYSKIIESMQSQKRILTLFSQSSETSGLLTSSTEYLHFGSWYQAQKHGWSDFNFAVYSPQIVRFKPNKMPNISSRSGVVNKDWIISLDNCKDYDYLLMKTKESPTMISTWLAENPRCKTFILENQQQDWLLFKKIKENEAL